MNNIIFNGLLIGACAYAFWRGGSDSRSIAVMSAAASIVTHLLLRWNPDRFSSIELGVLVIDVATLIGFVCVALGSSRFWPLWIAGLQLTTLLAHVAKEVEMGLVPQAYAAAAVFWSYPILIILAVGTWREHQRRLLDC